MIVAPSLGWITLDKSALRGPSSGLCVIRERSVTLRDFSRSLHYSRTHGGNGGLRGAEKLEALA
jgi:hypothetical protein